MNKRFRLAEIFTDNMVLQNESKIVVWGVAVDDSIIEVKFCGQNVTAKVLNGQWLITLLPINAGGPFKMYIRNGSDKIILKNILIGEVWLAGGQSNMEHPLLLSQNGNQYVLTADNPNIRFYTVPKRPFEDALVDGWHFAPKKSSNTLWKVCNSQNAGLFSAVAFHFAKGLQKAIDVPIGIIECNWGATSAACWMSEKYLSEDELDVYLKEYDLLVSNLDNSVYEIQFTQYLNDLKRFIISAKKISINPDKVDEYLMDINVKPIPIPPLGPKSFMRPTGLYYTMLKKIIPFTIKGVIWYQGESDSNRPILYKELFSKMIQNWRNDWSNPDLPFLFVQLASFDGDWIKENSWADLRESQSFVAKNIKHTAMAVAIDCGDKENIHPSNKLPIGKRLVLLARNNVYGHNIVCSGPEYSDMKVENGKAILFFNNIGEGLCFTGEEIKGFRICGEDKKFVNAKAKINGDAIEVSSSKVKNPIGASYGWANFTDANLYNMDGLPACPFKIFIS